METAKYSDIRLEIKSCDLIEGASNGLLGPSIRFFTCQNVNHTMGAIWERPCVSGDPNARDLMEKRLDVGEAIGGGFTKTFLNEKLESYKGVMYWITLKPEYDYARDRIEYEALQLEGREYDWTSLVRNAWRRVPLDDKKLLCSEAWQFALIRSGILPADYSPTGQLKHAGTGIRPGEFGRTGLYLKPIKIVKGD